MNLEPFFHLISAFVLAVVGGGVCLWAFLPSRPRWDRFWVGLFLLLVCAPVAGVVSVVRMKREVARMRLLDGSGERDREAVVVDSAGPPPAEAPAETARLER